MATSQEQAAVHNRDSPEARLLRIPNEILEKICEALDETTNGQALKFVIRFTRDIGSSPGSPPLGPNPRRWIPPNAVRLKLMTTCRQLWHTLPFRAHARVTRFAHASDIKLPSPYNSSSRLHSVELAIQRRLLNYSTWDGYADLTMRIGYTPTAFAAAMPTIKSLVIKIEEQSTSTAGDATTRAAVDRFCNELIAIHPKLSSVAMAQAGRGRSMIFTLSDQ